tara:strand:- start:295 stop:408 length:114 start_codon:yes stop_codon:yes gene_type:complete
MKETTKPTNLDITIVILQATFVFVFIGVLDALINHGA